MNAAQDKDFKLAIVRKLIQSVEQIDPAKLKLAGGGHRENQVALWEDVLVGLETLEGLKGIAARLKADRLSVDRDLRDAAKEFEPFATFTGKATAGDTFEGILPLIRAEHDEIVQSGLVSGMEAPVRDLELQDDSVAEISRWKWTLLFVLYALEFAILYGLEASIWNLIRALGGDKFTDPKRIATEIAAAITVAFTLPDFHRLLTHVLARAGQAPAFNGDVNIVTEHGEMIITSLLGGLSIDAGVHLATKLAGDDASVIKYWMFLGYFAAFLSAGLINGAGQVALGRKLVVGPSGQPFPDNAKDALAAFGKHYISTDILLHERLFHFVNWFLYNFYGAGFGKGELELAGSLWLFVALFKVSFFWSEKMRQRLGQ